MNRYQTLTLVILAFAVSGAIVLLTGSNIVAGAISGAFLGVVGAYTALDLRALVKNTAMLPQGQFAVADKWKYIVGIVLICALFVLCVIKEKTSNIQLEMAYGILGPGAVAIIGVMVAGIKANKAATISGPQAPKHNQ